MADSIAGHLSNTSKVQLQTKLKLPWIKSQSWLAKSRLGRDSRSERIVRHTVVRVIERIEPVGHHIERDSLTEAETATQTHVKCSIVKATSGVAADGGQPHLGLRPLRLSTS